MKLPTIAREAARFHRSKHWRDVRTIIGTDTNYYMTTGRMESYLRGRLEPLGFKVVAGPATESGEANLIALKGGDSGHGRGLQYLFNTHMDTVAPGSKAKWTRTHNNPFNAVLDPKTGAIYGLGASDTKLNIVSLLIALDRLRGRRLANQIALTFTYGEENGMRGVTDLCGSGGYRLLHPDASFVGEPTGLDLVIQHKGRIRPVICIEIPKNKGKVQLQTATFTVKGKSAHSSKPESGEDAIHKALTLLQSERFRGAKLIELSGGNGQNMVPDSCRVKVGFRPDQLPDSNGCLHDFTGEMVDNGQLAAVEALKDFLQAIYSFQETVKAEQSRESIIDPPYTTVLPTVVKVNPAAGKIEIYVCHRFLPDPAADAIAVSKARFEKVFHQVQAKHGKVPTSLAFPGEGTPSFSVDPAKSFIGSLLKYGRESLGREPRLVGAPYGTEAGFFNRLTQGDSTVVFGPGFPEVIHEPNEYTKVRQLMRAADFYEAVIRQMVTLV
jgi:acetylornithine deacetylase/succinyl-diaminopimelate desuccinylase-like protein